jgi:superfamily II DNA or RNA helicase
MPEPIILKDHQSQAIDGLRAGIRAGHRSQVLMAPTGGGKTVIGAKLLAEANGKFRKAAFLVDRISLVDQTSAVLDRYGIHHGVIQAKHWRWRPYERIQVCSAQTIEKCGFPADLKLLIVDEGHATRQFTKEFIKSHPDITVVALSATPFTEGMGQIYTNLVNVCTTNELIEAGDLAPLKMYAAKAINMAGAKVVAGEWSEKEIEQRGMEIIGDIVSEWVDKTNLHFGGPVKTLVFSATVDHGEELCRQFNAAGFNFQQISYKDNSDDTRLKIEEFRKSDSSIDGLISCEVFTKGFDVPDILCGIAARPYRKSLSSHIQQLGRLMRSSPGKEFGLWLDHCGNVMRFKDDVDDIFQNGMKELDDGERESKVRKEPGPKEIKEFACVCGYVFPQRMDVCPSCGKEHVRQSLVETVAGFMEEVSNGQADKRKTLAYLKDKKSVWRQLIGDAMKRKKGAVGLAESFAKAQFMQIYGHFPKDRFYPEFAEPICEELRGKVQANLIAYHKSQQKRGSNAGIP